MQPVFTGAVVTAQAEALPESESRPGLSRSWKRPARGRAARPTDNISRPGRGSGKLQDSLASFRSHGREPNAPRPGPHTSAHTVTHFTGTPSAPPSAHTPLVTSRGSPFASAHTVTLVRVRPGPRTDPTPALKIETHRVRTHQVQFPLIEVGRMKSGRIECTRLRCKGEFRTKHSSRFRTFYRIFMASSAARALSAPLQTGPP